MEKNRAIPPDYMTVGNVAKKMGVTVRTLQYYDKEGLLSPSAESEGGRRLYTDRDLVKLHQILSMKYLGFSLGDIKNRLTLLDTPEDVAAALTSQAESLRIKIADLTESLQAIEALKGEVLQMHAVDFKKYADIIVNLQMKNEMYGLIKYFDESTLEHIRNHFTPETGAALIDTFNRLYDEVIKLQAEGVKPDSEAGLRFAKAYWDMVMEFTGEDMSLLPKLTEYAATLSSSDPKWQEKLARATGFIEPALENYFLKLNHNPFKEG